MSYDAKFKLYKFYNILNIVEIFQNLRSIMLSEGWTVLNYWIDSNNFPNLIFRVPGYPGQNLYYHLKGDFYHEYEYHVITIAGGLGYNSSTNQLTNIWDTVPSDEAFPIYFPIKCLYVFINQYGMIVCFEMKDRIGIPIMFIGTIRLYTQSAQGNTIYCCKRDKTTDSIKFGFDTSLLTSIYYITQKKVPIFSVVFFIYMSPCLTFTDIGYIYGPDYNLPEGPPFTYTEIIEYYYRYHLEKNFLHMPILFIIHSEANYNYCFPIGELPFYVTRFHPHYKIGDEVWYGTKRKFVMMPIGHLTGEWGFAIEITT